MGVFRIMQNMNIDTECVKSFLTSKNISPESYDDETITKMLEIQLRKIESETGIFVLVEYLRCLDSKWRIHIHRKIPMTRHHILRLDMPYKIQQFLSSAHCK